jgi:hypothetical protein
MSHQSGKPGSSIGNAKPAATIARYSSRKASATLDVASRDLVTGQQFGLAFDEIGTSQRRNTKVRLTHRWRRQSRANPSLKTGNSLLAG